MKKINDYLREHPLLLTALIIGSMIALIGISMFFTDILGGSEGLGGYIDSIFWRSIIALIAFIAGIAICRRYIARNRTGEKRPKNYLMIALSFTAALIIVVFALKDPVRDIPFLFSPEITYLKNLKFDIYYGENTLYHQVNGTDSDGKEQTFDLNESTYEQGEKFLSEDPGLMLKVWYLPETEVVMKLQFIYDLDEAAYEARINSELSDRLLDCSVQINDEVYQLPVAVEELLQEGWRFESKSDESMMIAPLESPYEDHPMITLVNEKEQEITVFVRNMTDSDAPTEECIADILSVDNYDLKFEGIDVILPGNIALGWADIDEVTAVYGEPDEEEGDWKKTVTYKPDGEEDGHMVRLEFDEEGVLDSVWIENEEAAQEEPDTDRYEYRKTAVCRKWSDRITEVRILLQFTRPPVEDRKK